ncbi:MAG: hypothetical protein WC856_22260 [Methylococcaceae bacterium]|jgi:hypothetical protein
MNYLPFILLALLAVFGISIEMDPTAKPWQLFTGLHLAGLGAMSCMYLWALKDLPTKNKRYGFVILQFLAFRIAYFPIVVFAATVACYSELLLQHLPVDLPIKIFPAFFISAAVMFASIGVVSFWALKGKTVLYGPMVVLGIPALLISFADMQDLTMLPDNNWADLQPLPSITHPQTNPYSLAYASNHSSAGQKMIGLAGRVLYEFIPKAPWSQAVQGTLEQEFRNNPEGNSHDQLKYHYAAFLAAHQSIKSTN